MTTVLTTSGYAGQICKLLATTSVEEVGKLCTPMWFSALLRAIKVCGNAKVYVDSVDIAMNLSDPRYQAFKAAARSSKVVGLPYIRAVGAPVAQPQAPAVPPENLRRRQFGFDPNGPFAAVATMRR